MRAALILLFFCLGLAYADVNLRVANHTNNWAILVDTSRFWFNYRHIANTLSLYHTVKRLGIPDSQIILMLADDVACNPRNPFAGTVYNNLDHKLNLYGENVEVDYRGYEVTVENFIRLLTGRHAADVPRSKRLLTDETSNILVFLTGHGGDEFLKFQDYEEITSSDLGDAFETMSQKNRYNEILFMVDTCQAATLFNRFYSPEILAIGSSRLGENSYSHHTDRAVGVSVIDRFTYYLLEFLEGHSITSNATLGDMLRMFTEKTPKLNSHPEWRTDLFSSDPDEVRLVDFFGSAGSTVPVYEAYPLEREEPTPVDRRSQAEHAVNSKQRTGGEEHGRAGVLPVPANMQSTGAFPLGFVCGAVALGAVVFLGVLSAAG